MLLSEFPAYTRETLLRADWLGLLRILEYRHAKSALDLFNSGRDGAEKLSSHPELIDLLLEMKRAQSPHATEAELFAGLELARPKDDDE